MTPAAKAPSRRSQEQAGPWPPSPWGAPPLTTEERLKRIEAMGERIAGYVRFMGQVGSLSGTSGEMKDRAVAAFCERVTLAESDLRRIQEDLRLG